MQRSESPRRSGMDSHQRRESASFLDVSERAGPDGSAAATAGVFWDVDGAAGREKASPLPDKKHRDAKNAEELRYKRRI